MQAAPPRGSTPSALDGSARVAVLGLRRAGPGPGAQPAGLGRRGVVGLRPDRRGEPTANARGSRSWSREAAAGCCDVIAMLVPDEVQPQLYDEVLAPAMRRARRWCSRTATTFTTAACSRGPTWTS
jgi:ketol-acid reductoisomerase